MLCQTQFSFFRLKVPFATPRHKTVHYIIGLVYQMTYFYFFLYKCHQFLRVQQSFRLLKQKRLVGGSASLGHKQELILITRCRVQLDLRWQICTGVCFLEHVQWCHLDAEKLEKVLFA